MFLLFFVSGETPDYIYIPPKSPFEKGGLLGGFSQPLYKKKENNYKIFQKRVRELDAMSY
jgi:hypothetical protein